MANVTDTIIEQLGGRQIFAMAFRHALTTENSITFHVAKGLKTTNRIDRVHVAYDVASDTYSVGFHRYNRKVYDLVTIRQVEGVYADMLRGLVESETGLRMTLGTCTRVAA